MHINLKRDRIAPLIRAGAVIILLALANNASYGQQKQEQKHNEITNNTLKKNNTMEKTTSDFTTSLLVDQTSAQAFKAITNVRGWWSEEVEGGTDQLNDVFSYHYKDVHSCKMKITELVPGKKIVWQVLENHFSFTKDKSEWVDTKIIFELAEKDGKTLIHFTHKGLVPEYECYEICHDSWDNYIKISLRDLITTGKGQPNPKDKERAFNEQLIKQHVK